MKTISAPIESSKWNKLLWPWNVEFPREKKTALLLDGQKEW